jgi:hypothetical protein
MYETIVTKIDELNQLKCPYCDKLLEFEYEGRNGDRQLAYCCAREFSTEIYSVKITDKEDPYAHYKM